MAEPPASTPRRRWLKRVAIAGATLVALIVAAWLAVPPIVRSQAESRLTEALGRTVTIEKVAFDPFSLEVRVLKLAIAEPSGTAAFVTCDEIVANLSSASLWHRAPVLDALRIVRPSIALARDSGGRYSVHDLLDRPAREPAAPPPRFSLNNIEVEDATIRFDDGVAQRRHTLDRLVLGIPFVSSLPYQTDIRVTPRAEGAFNGSHFALGGTSAPFAERAEAAIDLDLDALPLAQYVAYLPSRPRFDVAGGTLTTRLKVVFVDGAPGERRLELRGDARVDALALKRRDGSPLLAAERIAVALDRIDVLGRDARVASLTLDAPSVEVLRASDGTFELAGPWLDAPARPVPAPARASPDPPWTASVAKASIARGVVRLADAGSTFRSTLVDVAVDAQNLSTRAGDKAKVAVAFVTDDRIASFKGEAEVEPMLPAATGRFELAKFSLALLFPYYKDVLAVDVQKGSLDLASRFAYSSERGFTLAEGEATIDDLRLAFPRVREPLWRVPRLAAKGVDVDVAGRKVAIGDLHSRGATLRIARERDGTLEAARLVKTTPATGTAAGDRTWAVAVKRLALERVALDVEDRVPEPAVRLAAREVDVVLGDFSNARGARSTLALKARLGERGRLAFNGPVTTNPFSIEGQVDVANLSLVPLKPYVESRVNVLLAGGSVAAKGRLAVDAATPGAAKATWKGGVTLSDFAALDRPTSSDLARWKTLALDDVDVATSPFRLSLGRIGLDDYYARVIVYQDGTLNLTRLLTPGAEPEPAPGAPQAPLVKAEREALPIAIGKIELARGNVNLSDFFVRPNYQANLTDVTGTITATSADRAGDVAIAARVDRTAPVEVSGRIQPFAKELSLDLTARARDVDLPPLTPYSIKYAGYGIEKGKLTFDVHYRIEDRKLAAENRLVLDQLTFNRERVDSPTATKLPVLLAVALLQDRNGVIDLQLPISGTLDDPQFSVFGIIVQVIVNLIGKAATAPFALLASAFGGGPELSTVPFVAGSDRLGAEGVKRVETLGKALADRPGLKLDIGGRADPAVDREALVRASVDDAIRRAKVKSLAATGAPADAVTVTADERARWLAAAYRDAPIKERPRNAIGMLQEVPPAQMEAMLATQAKVDDDALRLLANARAQAVKDALAAKGVPADRLFLTAPKLGGEGAATAVAEAPAAPASLARVDLALR